jgi:hypothetical protein
MHLGFMQILELHFQCGQPFSNVPINLVESFTTVPEVGAFADYVAIFFQKPFEAFRG